MSPEPETFPAETGRAVDSLNDLIAELPNMRGDEKPRYGETPEDHIHDNTGRAGRAAEGLIAYASPVFHNHNDEVETMFADFLGDLRHLADALDFDFDDLLRRGANNHHDELHGRWA